MAVYTPLDKYDIEQIISQYAVGEVLGFEGIVGGVDNSNFKIITTSSPYILTLFEERMDVRELPYYLSLMAELQAQGIHCPTPIKRKNGEVLSTIRNKSYALFSFLKGHIIIERNEITPVLCAEAGTLLAKMHLAGQKTNLFRTNSMGWNAWNTRLQKALPKQTDDYCARALDEMQFLKSAWPTDLPCGNVHLDLFPNNVFVIDGHINSVFDFYFAATDFLAFDLAITLNAWCFDVGKFNQAKWNAMLDAYQNIRPLTPAEKDHFQTLARGAAMRFYSSRLHDLTFHDPKNLVVPHDPMEYWEILSFHQDTQVF